MELDKLNSILLTMKLKFTAIHKLREENHVIINSLKNIETEMKEVLEQTFENTNEMNLMLAAVHLGLGMEYVNIKELNAGEEEFMKCLTILKGRELEPRAILTVLDALNQLGIIWSQWNQPQRAKEFLERAELIYNNSTNLDDSDDVINATQWVCIGMEISSDKLAWREALEEVHTLILYYLAQVYESLKDHDKSALYCHMTLSKQLRAENKNLDYVDWVLNAATLSQYFLKNGGFSQARHHLAAASYMLHMHELRLMKKQETEGDSEALAAELETARHRSADVARCWAKYGINLLSLSRKRLLRKTEEDDEDEDEDEDKDKPQITTKPITEKQQENRVNELKFKSHETNLEPFVSQITDQYLSDFNDAKPVFLTTLKWLEEAKLYYTLENHASDYVLIVQDISQAYKNLLFFEEHEDRQAKMHKRRIDILESVVHELNPQYYKYACRQIWIELGETYSDILYIKLQRLRESNEKVPLNTQAKINRLVESAIKNFQLFLNSVETGMSDTGIPKFPEDVVEPALYAYFHLGRLYTKTITLDKRAELGNIQNSINAYKFILDYCEKYPDAAPLIHNVITLCKDFLNVLPLRANQLMKLLRD